MDKVKPPTATRGPLTRPLIARPKWRSSRKRVVPPYKCGRRLDSYTAVEGSGELFSCLFRGENLWCVSRGQCAAFPTLNPNKWGQLQLRAPLKFRIRLFADTKGMVRRNSEWQGRKLTNWFFNARKPLSFVISSRMRK